ncbi:MAG: hypothetical protein AB4042_12475 [Leptolyngbyaceae cyanobacterium]
MDKKFLENLLKLCLEQNLQLMLDKSYKDYHVKGFNSLILSHSENLTIRLYVCKPGETELNPGNDNILVHNHSFDFQTQVLTGYMENAVYEVSKNDENEGVWYKYVYESALENQDHLMKLRFLEKVHLSLTKLQKIDAGSSYFLYRDEFHRIFVPQDRLVSMLFWQHQKVKQTPIIFSKVSQSEIFSTEGLYNRFSGEAELYDLIDLVIKNLS